MIRKARDLSFVVLMLLVAYAGTSGTSVKAWDSQYCDGYIDGGGTGACFHPGDFEAYAFFDYCMEQCECFCNWVGAYAEGNECGVSQAWSCNPGEGTSH
jgi:hypothetical protein